MVVDKRILCFTLIKLNSGQCLFPAGVKQYSNALVLYNYCFTERLNVIKLSYKAKGSVAHSVSS